ncbi:MAG: hypothetical protein ACPLKZ_02085 [Candidatus Bathyarchaeales archaeon]
MPPLDNAILLAANPFLKEIGDVEFHREHLRRNGGVFWDIVPMGKRDAPWKHPEIHSGYFYISPPQKVKYWVDIEYIKRWKELDLKQIERYIPKPRNNYLQSTPESKMYYAILIRDMHDLKPERNIGDFTLASTNKQVKRVRNYVIIRDPGWR